MVYDKDYIIQRTVIAASGCWEWQKAIGSHGYGALSRGRLAHRLAYELWHGELGMFELVMHSCDNRKCCNPNHLVKGKHGNNTNDAMEKGRLIIPPGKLTDEQVREIRRRVDNGESQTQIAKEFDCQQPHVSRICNFVRRENVHRS